MYTLPGCTQLYTYGRVYTAVHSSTLLLLYTSVCPAGFDGCLHRLHWLTPIAWNSPGARGCQPHGRPWHEARVGRGRVVSAPSWLNRHLSLLWKYGHVRRTSCGAPPQRTCRPLHPGPRIEASHPEVRARRLGLGGDRTSLHITALSQCGYYASPHSRWVDVPL
jgi:hypothetical protein